MASIFGSAFGSVYGQVFGDTGAGGGGDYPPEGLVLSGTVYGPSDEYTGTLILPDVDDVRLATGFGAEGGLTGTVVIPVESDVLLGVPVDGTNGTARLPSEFQVQTGVSFGPSDSLTGSLDSVGTSGPFAITVNIEDSSTGDPIALARVRLKTLGQSGSKQTDAGGQALFAAAADTYDVTVVISGYESYIGQLVVIGDDTLTISLAPILLEGSSDPRLCNVAVDVINQFGRPVAGATVLFNVYPKTTFAMGAIACSNRRRRRTNSNGRATAELVKASEFSTGYPYNYTITVITSGGSRKSFEYVVPDSDSDIATVIV